MAPHTYILTFFPDRYQKYHVVSSFSGNGGTWLYLAVCGVGFLTEESSMAPKTYN
jgi:hypothetical protein